MYYKDSIRLEFNLTDILGNGLNLDDFYIRVVLSAGGAGKFVAERFSSDTERNCELSGDILTVTANRHGLRPGKLTAEVTALMSGGHRMTRIIDTGITLTETDTILPDTAPFRVAYPLLKGPQGIQGEPFLFADLTAAQKKELAQPAVDEAAKFGDTVDQLDADFKVVAGMHLAFQKEIEKAENIKGEMRLRFRTADGFWLGFGFHPGQSSVGMGYRTNEADAAIWTIEPFEGNTYFLMKNRHDQYVKFGAYRIELTDDRKQATPVGILQHPKDPQYFRICQMDNNNLCIGGDSVKDWSPAYCDKSPDNATTRLIVENVDARKLGLLDGKDMWMGAPISVTNHEDFDKFCTEITRRVDDAERTVTASAQTADSARTDIDIALKEVDSWQEVLDILTATDRAVAAAETARVTEFAELKTEAETATTAATTAAVEAVLAKRALFDDMWLAAVKNYGALDHSHIEEDGCIRPYYLNGLWLTYEEALYSFVAYHKGTNWSEMFAKTVCGSGQISLTGLRGLVLIFRDWHRLTRLSRL